MQTKFDDIPLNTIKLPYASQYLYSTIKRSCTGGRQKEQKRAKSKLEALGYETIG